ncbi:TrkH family potassium uptake protein [Streptococcus halotolerans]|uniref:TrkH family potassium uptake protein n=1 Tax=Streptococcus halotolerans TaxID=1814128 RepID=UPI000786F7DC|nr:potassium transporter TrkG [Streptococcus halotolerans]
MSTFISKWSVTQRLSFSFIIVILIGSLILSQPFTHYANAPQTSYFDHLFNVTSMVCVTGLSVFAVGDVYNGIGQVIVMLLMQIGGLGLVTLIAISSYVLHRKMNLSDQSLLQSALSRDSGQDLKRFLYMVYQFTFIIESLAALILMIDFIPRFGLGHGIFNAMFLAISAFCNAGFDNFGSSSLQHYATNPIINFTIIGLIIAGGLGFGVWQDIIQCIKNYLSERPKRLSTLFRPLSNQSRLVLKTTTIILVIGTLLSWLLEWNNTKTIGNLSPSKQFMASLFQTVTMRTAGFATIDYENANPATNFLYMIQMVMGGSPGGTAGGIKVTVVAIIALLFKAELSGQTEVTFHHRTIDNRIIKQTLTIIIFFFSLMMAGFLLLLIVEKTVNPFKLLFEVSSAIATVGVSMNVTADLSTSGRIIIMILMFIGRVGPVTVLLSLLQKKEKTIHYAKANISVG